jgi:hypothetical protein
MEEGVMARSRIAARLARKWRAAPQAQVRAIVRTVADIDEAVAFLEQRKLKVIHRYRLLPALTVSGAAQDVLALADEDWITKIEEDMPVHTMPD